MNGLALYKLSHWNDLEKIIILLLVIVSHLTLFLFVFDSTSIKNDPITMPKIQGVLLIKPAAETVALPSAKTQPDQLTKNNMQEKIKQPSEPIAKTKIAESEQIKPVEKVEKVAKPLIKNQTAKEIESNNKTNNDLSPPKKISSLPTKDNNFLGAPVIPPTLDANPLNNPAPAYPKLSRRLKEEGTVILEILILADGSVGEVKVKESSGFERLDQTAMQAIKQWHYIPARKAQRNIEYWYLQPLHFNLK